MFVTAWIYVCTVRVSELCLFIENLLRVKSKKKSLIFHHALKVSFCVFRIYINVKNEKLSISVHWVKVLAMISIFYLQLNHGSKLKCLFVDQLKLRHIHAKKGEGGRRGEQNTRKSLEVNFLWEDFYKRIN